MPTVCGSNLLSLAKAARAELMETLLIDTPPAAQRAEHEAALRRRLEERGVFRLGVGEVAELLASVQDDETD